MILKIFISSLAVYLTGWLLPGIGIDNYLTAIILSIILGLLNTFVKPIMVFLSAPITLLTLGLFIFIIDAIIIEMASSLLDGFVVNGFGWAMLFSIVLSITTSLLGKIIDKE
ncbi:MAG: phage holin family protein [Paludibacteraceae bacterium]|nr:phage holin family protein [Paludibacteraceae bacterium]